MESWEDYNYYTLNETRQVELMNISTPEWDIGYLVPNVVAIPGRLNSTHNFKAGTFVVENASRAEFGSRDIEKVLFGALSGLVIAWAIGWLVWHIKTGTLFSPRGSSSHPTEAGEAGGGVLPLHENRNNGLFISAATLRTKLRIYYDAEVTELELYRRTVRTDGVAVEDVEAATELLRRMYLKDWKLWATQSTHETSPEERQLWMDQRDALWLELRAVVKEWSDPATAPGAGWTGEEQHVVAELAKMLNKSPQGQTS